MLFFGFVLELVLFLEGLIEGGVVDGLGVLLLAEEDVTEKAVDTTLEGYGFGVENSRFRRRVLIDLSS